MLNISKSLRALSVCMMTVVALQATSAVAAEASPAAEAKGFRIVTIGTSGPPLDLENPDRTWPATLVQFDDKYFLVDCGGGATHGLLKAGIPPAKVHNLLFTHHHADHDSDYFTFAIGGWNGPAGRRVLNVVGTDGTKKLHDFMLDFYKEDIAYRLKYGFPPEGLLKNVTIKEIERSETFQLDGVKVTAASGVHTIPDLAYRFDAGQQSVVVTGDTALSDGVIQLAMNADVLVADAHMSSGRFATMVMADPAQRANMKAAHMDNKDLAEVARRANVKKLILTHLPPMAMDVAATIREMREVGFTGEIVVAETGKAYRP